MIKVIDRHGNETTARALVDQGSQSSFVLESLTKRLNFKTKSTRAQITGIGSSGEYCRKGVTLGIKSMSGNKIIDNAEALVLKNLTNYGQNLRPKVKDWKHINGLTLADPYFSKPGKIEVLLGADLFPYNLTDGLVKGPPSTPMAKNTLLGWILVGPVTCQTENAPDSTIQVTNLHSSSLDLSDQLKRFWELEEVQAPTRSLPEDEQCETFYKETVTRQDGRYIVQLPFKVPEPALGESENTALTRFMQLKRRFDKNTELAERYSQHMQEYIDLKHMTEVPYSQQQLMHQDNGYPGFYLPHHPVFKESTTTSLRVVYNASQKSANGISLNDSLLTGPNIQEKMANILFRWRLYKVAFTADITKMYRMINVAENHQDCQRIIWRDNNSQPIKHYRLTTVTFGMEPSAFLAIRTLKQLAQDEDDIYPIGCEAIRNDFHIDDLMSGSDNVEDALTKQKQVTAALERGGFTLRKWASNCTPVLAGIPQESQQVSNVKEIYNDRHIKTLAQNPADLATRGVTPVDQQARSLWWNGPEWLAEPQSQWPKNHCSEPITLEEKKVKSIHVSSNEEFDLMTKFSSLSKLTRVTAYILRFSTNCKVPKSERNLSYLTAEELEPSFRILISIAQNQDIESLRNKKRLIPKSRLLPLAPFIDKDGILRVGGRLKNADLKFSEKHPVILCPTNFLTKLIIERTHLETLHGVIQLTLSTIRREFWIIKARSAIKSVIHKCITCWKLKAKISEQLMGDLPAPRVQQSRVLPTLG
ncbi:hypothetical protein JTE90_019644 [Oedothorax gibbosus]|uniref:Integrase zinc-binding domain-containing protein n=1 Tax=Oedothorax gibbosus TaxID=931172 RepID=A0AAV6U1A8_9ARAC|nr:hypothetical protein JTE90_019644 [Oedothorax gibbosus]